MHLSEGPLETLLTLLRRLRTLIAILSTLLPGYARIPAGPASGSWAIPALLTGASSSSCYHLIRATVPGLFHVLPVQVGANWNSVRWVY